MGLHLYKGALSPSFLTHFILTSLSLFSLSLAQVLPSTLVLLKCFQALIFLSSAPKHSLQVSSAFIPSTLEEHYCSSYILYLTKGVHLRQYLVVESWRWSAGSLLHQGYKPKNGESTLRTMLLHTSAIQLDKSSYLLCSLFGLFWANSNSLIFSKRPYLVVSKPKTISGNLLVHVKESHVNKVIRV